MYDDNQMNNNVPRFDSQTGEPLFTGDVQNAQDTQSDTSDTNTDSAQQPSYTYYDVNPVQQPQKSARELKREQKAMKKAAKHEQKKHNGGAGYFAKLVISAVIFGLIAGGVMFGVNKAGEKLDGSTSSASDIQIPMVSNHGNGTDASVNAGTSSVVQTEDSTISAPMDVKGIVKTSMPSIVAINGEVTVSSGYSYPFSGTQKSKTSGTGIIVGKNDNELLIVTNAHVVDGVSNLTCTFTDNEQVSATVKGSKSNKDIAVVAVSLSSLKESTAKSIAIAELGDSDSIELGDQVVAIGNALGEGQSVTVGYVSALNRSIVVDNTEYTNLIMTDAAINPGNSGGALLNASGRVIGINSAKYSSEEVEGMGYAIPISSIKDVLDTLMNKQTRQKVSGDKASFLGISGVDVTYSISKAYGYPQGILLQNVQQDSPADKAGLVKNDIITGFDGDSISSFSDLKEKMQYYASGEKVTIDYYHMENGEYKLKSAEVTLGHNSN